MNIEGICFIAGIGSILVVLPMLAIVQAVRRKYVMSLSLVKENKS